MSRHVLWGILPLVGASIAACTFDFDAPFAGAGGGAASGTGTSAGETTTSSPTGSSDSSSSTSSAGDGGSGAGAPTSSTSSGSAGGEDPPGIPCGDERCEFEVDQGGCCWDAFEAHGAPRGECFASPPTAGQCRTTDNLDRREVLIRCQDASDCDPGLDCCAAYENDGGDAVYDQVACADACGANTHTLCDPGASDPCPLSEADCVPVPGLPDGYFGCLF